MLLTTALAGLPGVAAAQLPQGFYVAAGLGVNIPQDASVEPRGGAQNAFRGNTGEVRFNTLPMGTVALGYGFGNGIRVELEGSLRANTVDSAKGFSPIQPILQAQGQLWQIGAMANAYVDFNLGENAWIQPYVGVGLGYVYGDWRDFRVAGRGPTDALRLAVDAGDGNFAYQAIVGAAFPIAAVPGLSATAEYRFLGQIDPDFQASVANLQTGQTVPGKVEINPYQHAVMVGLRYVPGVRQALPEPMAAPLVVPPRAAAPAPAVVPAPARTFVVYFDINSASLTARARDLVAEAAQAARAGAGARIEVTGHTDRSGTPAGNQRLSLRRAQVVAAELVRRGVARGDITIRGAGETEPAVQTADGVREPQNRRVEIVIR
jgi:outer membrane protein OmpA-like peptidoglycan-associated protein